MSGPDSNNIYFCIKIEGKEGFKYAGQHFDLTHTSQTVLSPMEWFKDPTKIVPVSISYIETQHGETSVKEVIHIWSLDNEHCEHW